MDYILKMEGISKSFFGVEVLHHVHLHVARGTVHALLGENGAGKSTLMNILGGVYTKDTGSVVFDGETLEDITIKKAEAAGIAFVHQELNFFNTLPVYENIFIGRELKNKFGILDKPRMIEECEQLFHSLGVHINPRAQVSELPTGEKQIIQIVRAIHLKAKLFILDEPTTALSNAEIEHLFTLIRRLKDEGATFIFISHKMPEIFAICDDFTVLRNGSLISEGHIKNANPLDITRDIAGKSLENSNVYLPRELGEIVLEVSHLTGPGFEDISFKARKGEIIGLTGLQGAGSSELLQTLFGVNRALEGTVTVQGKELKTGSIKRAMEAGIGMIPSNRKENSVIPLMSLLENEYISEHQLSFKHQYISYGKEKNKFEKIKGDMKIKCNSPDDLIVSLSGGNQQKVIVGRWLNTDCDILLMDNPTQGIDVGAKEEIYQLMLRLASIGKTIIFNTLEIAELQKTADVVHVFYHGKMVAELPHEDINEENVMMHATQAVQVLKEGGSENDL